MHTKNLSLRALKPTYLNSNLPELVTTMIADAEPRMAASTAAMDVA